MQPENTIVRIGKKTKLPVNLYQDRSNGGYFRYKHPITKKWYSLGNNLVSAVNDATLLNLFLTNQSKFVRKILQTKNNIIEQIEAKDTTSQPIAMSFKSFIEHFYQDILPTRDISKSTLDDYKSKRPHLIRAFGDKDVSQITIRDISLFLDQYPARQSNAYRGVLAVIYKYLIAEGLVERNLAINTIKKHQVVKRSRLSFEGYQAIYNNSPDWLKNAMDIALMTGQRVGDIAEMKHSDIKEGFLYIKQSKTSQALKIPVIGGLLTVINRCKSTNCDYLISIKGKAITSGHISKSFCAARKESGVYDMIESPPTFHEIRSLSARLQKQSGIDKKITQNWLGHATEQMTDLYLSRGEQYYQEIPQESVLTFSQLITL